MATAGTMNTVVITGIGRGIGRALAEKFLAGNWRVLGTVTAPALDHSAPALVAFSLDLANPASVAKAAAAVSAAADEGVDVLINNAAVLLDEEETGVRVDKLRATLEVNLIGTIDWTERLIGAVKPGGHVINVSSSAGSLSETGHSSHLIGHYPAYKISKAALNMYTRTLALEHQGRLIVSSVNPGWTRTEMGGAEAPLTPAAAAEAIFKLSISRPESGQFWSGSENYPW